MNTILFVGEHPKTHNVRWHVHEHWELVYCTGGQGAFQFENGIVINYQEGETVAVPPHQPHINTSETGFTNIYITLGEPSFSYTTPFRVSDDEEQSLRLAFSQAKTYFMSDIEKRALVLAALGSLIASYIVVFRDNMTFSDPVERIRASIIRNYTRSNYDMEGFIRTLPFHYDYLRKLFKKEMKLSPLEYLNKLRMKNAEKMLISMRSNEYTMAEIAQMCGFEDPLYFSRVFKKYYGCAPSVFAKERPTRTKGEQDRTEIEKE